MTTLKQLENVYENNNIMPMTENTLYSIIVNIITSNGKIISTRLNEKYFIKIGKKDIFDEMMNKTNFLPLDTKFRHRLLFVKDDVQSPPNCIICGKEHVRITTYNTSSDDKISEYCSNECMHKDPIIRNKKSIMWTDELKQSAKIVRSTTMMDKYGVEYNSQREEIKKIIGQKSSKFSLSDIGYIKLNDREWLLNEYVENKRSASDIAEEICVYYGTVIDYLREYGVSNIRKHYSDSLPEKKLVEFIKSIYDGEIITNTFDIISPKELDIYLPELKLAFEHNGLYSHTYNRFETETEKYKHYNKTKLCKDIGIQLIHIPANFMYEKTDILKSFIINKLGKSEKIFARKCELIEIDSKIEREFFDITHFQGYTPSSKCFALKYDNEIMCAMSFCVPRNNKNLYDWELLRFSSKLNVNVIGGFSKIFKYFCKNILGSGTIVTYCDSSISNGNVYKQNGFDYIGDTGLNYFWTDKISLFPRTMFMKHTLDKKLKSFNADWSEAENMFANKYRRYWGCGNMIFTWNKKGALRPF